MSLASDLVSFVSRRAVSLDHHARKRPLRVADRSVGGYCVAASAATNHGRVCELPGKCSPEADELFTGSQGTRRSARPLDLREGVTQLHCERTEQIMTVCPVAGFARLLQGGGGGPKPGRTDRLRGATEPVCCCRQFREIARARGSVDFPFRIDRRFAEFPQQGNDSGVVVT
jgi:hypothetical protein